MISRGMLRSQFRWLFMKGRLRRLQNSAFSFLFTKAIQYFNTLMFQIAIYQRPRQP
jgi:hypothetical protein